MQVCVALFKRERHSNDELGVAISKSDNCDSQVDLLIDANGEIVDAPVWSYQPIEYRGCFVFDPSSE